MKKVNKEIVDEVIREVLVKNNINWTHTEDIANNLLDEHRIPITTEDVYEIVDKVIEKVFG